MAHSGPEPNVTLSLLDRLVDQDLSLRTDPPQGRAQSLRQLKTSLRRDIEWLLNTRRSIEAMGDSSLEIERSLFNYGLPDISSLGVHSAQDQKRLLWMIESTIANFEPRIQGARVTMEPVAGSARVLRFQIQGLLRIDPAPERVTFDTVLELTSGEYQVKGD
ncbi:MAG: type VI secretion system baseplate subunit TssE [Bryobacteraceae bacterium]|jgi:type VI secretion system protein ImpF